MKTRNFIPWSLKHAIRDRDNCKCAYCGKYVTKKQRSYDHVWPHSLGGTDTPDNLVLTCISCNSRKGDKTLEEFTKYLVLEGFCSAQSARNIHERVNKRITMGV